MKTVEVLQAIENVISVGATRGFESVDDYGNKCVILLDIAGCLSDYHEASGTLDTLCHSTLSKCNLCNFRALQNARSEGKKWTYTTNCHFGNSVSRRSTDRHLQLRASTISSTALNRLGLHPTQLVSNRLGPVSSL